MESPDHGENRRIRHDDPSYDLSWSFNGVSCNVVRNHDGHWTAYYNNQEIRRRFLTRNQAENFLMNYINDL